MNRAALTSLILLLVLVAGAARFGPEPIPAAERIIWEKSWKDAVNRAKAETKPIMIHFNMDNEPACRNMASSHFKNSKIIELSKKFVCVVGSLGEHRDEEVFPGEDGECRRFGTVSCKEHRLSESDARADVLATSTVTAPQFVFTTPDGDILVRRPWDLPPGELIELMNRALYYYDPKLAPADMEKRLKENLDKLFEEASSDNARVRQRALDTLAKKDSPEIIEFLIGQTSPDVDEVKRNEAVKAIGENGNSNCLPALLKLLRDRSTRLRLNTLVALRKLGMRECRDHVVKAFGVEQATRNQAASVRVVAACDPESLDTRKFLYKSMGFRSDMVRCHALIAQLETKPGAKEIGKIAGLARGDTDTTVRAVACYVGTSIAVRLREFGEHVDSTEFADDPKKLEAAIKRKFIPALRKVARSDRSDNLRAYAAACLEAAEGQEDADYMSGVREFFDEDAAFSDDGDGGDGGGRGRGGRGGRR